MEFYLKKLQTPFISILLLYYEGTSRFSYFYFFFFFAVPVNPAFEDITPPSSGGYEEDDETETETNDEDYDVGFGLHNIQGGDTTDSETEVLSLGIELFLIQLPLHILFVNNLFFWRK